MYTRENILNSIDRKKIIQFKFDPAKGGGGKKNKKKICGWGGKM